jgi:hypothetical protein
MGIFSNIFNNGTGTAHNGGTRTAAPIPVPAGVAAPSATGPQPTNGNPGTPATVILDPNVPASQLDKFVGLWQTPTTEDGKPKPIAANPLSQPIFNFDAAKVTESAGKMNFAAGLDPELVSKALGGDSAAFTDALNQVVRNAVVGMTLSNGQLINSAMLTNNERMQQALPTQIKSVQLLSPSDNPVFSHPAAQPLVQSLKQMAFAKDPSADPAEINQQISDYLNSFAAEITGNSSAAIAAKRTDAAKTTNWLEFVK